MGAEGKLQKINIVYLLLNIFGPVMVMVLAVAIGVALPQQIGVFLAVIGFGLAVIWWSFLGRKVYDKTKEKKMAELKEQGFTPNQTFNADGCTVAVDLNKGQIAILFRWNPSKVYVRPASQITKVWVDDGRGGAGFLEGSSRVSFLFTVDGMTIRVNTFTSNKRWRMDSDYILTGISKADMMVGALKAAGAGAEAR